MLLYGIGVRGFDGELEIPFPTKSLCVSRNDTRSVGPSPGRSGYPKNSGRIIRVIKISGFRKSYPKLHRVL
jgi:hypothetical protein